MTIDGAGDALVAIAHLQVSNLTDQEIAAAHNGRLEVGVVRVTSRDATFPIILYQFAGMVFDAPLSIGLLSEDKRARLIHTLSHASYRDRSVTWNLLLETVDRSTGTTKALRVIAPSPRFWRITADALLQSVGVTRDVQQDALQRLYSKYPLPSQLLRRAALVERYQETASRLCRSDSKSTRHIS